MFNKLFSYCLILLGIFFAANASAFSVTENEINAYLAKKNQINDKFGLPGLFYIDYNLHDLSTKVGQIDEKRVEISGTIDGSFSLKNKPIVATLNLTFDTVPYYDPQEGSVYLKDVRILRWSGSPDSAMQQLQGIMPFLSQNIASLINHIPIYTLDDSKARDAIIKKFAKGIRVEQGKLVLESDFL
ncbi:DUF1439 domain-containing protein [Caviibacterium pharyngocola]|uniref:DUF1439 domain-containing protein n=1 Tax=Caviibacterium pharyngocola TaxID=28159 RepID=A0A2M8RWN9_9PAST|nr:DUF1439 domain-containing protein [Caviibacterium pharyngocola]PJG83302.1 DUF1439 domain-containing protein [Caviibacterium pharyngocola]